MGMVLLKCRLHYYGDDGLYYSNTDCETLEKLVLHWNAWLKGKKGWRGLEQSGVLQIGIQG